MDDFEVAFFDNWTRPAERGLRIYLAVGKKRPRRFGVAELCGSCGVTGKLARLPDLSGEAVTIVID